MPVPKRIKVGPHKYTVVIDAKTMAAVGGTGSTQNDTLQIYLEPGNAPSIEAETMLHEILHALWFQTGLYKKFDDGSSDSDGEDIVNRLSPGLLGVLRDNPRFVEYLLENK